MKILQTDIGIKPCNICDEIAQYVITTKHNGPLFYCPGHYEEKKEVDSQPMKDKVNSPEHYTCNPSGIEAIEITRHLNFNRGNAIKYILRASNKCTEEEDYNKAIWYLIDELQRLKLKVTVYFQAHKGT